MTELRNVEDVRINSLAGCSVYMIQFKREKMEI